MILDQIYIYSLLNYVQYIHLTEALNIEFISAQSEKVFHKVNCIKSSLTPDVKKKIQY